MNKMSSGKLIVIEGTDGSGKQTQAERLSARLKEEGFQCEIIGFPRYGTATGDIVGDCCLGRDNRINTGSWFENFSKVDSKIACLYYAADRLAASEEIRKKLDEGKIVILDRYVESNMGHQCGKVLDRKGRAELRDWIVELEYKLLKLPQPNLILFLHMPLKVSKILKKGMNEKLDAHEVDEDHLKNAENAYLELADYYGWEKISCSLDGNNPREVNEIHEEVYGIVREILS